MYKESETMDSKNQKDFRYCNLIILYGQFLKSTDTRK